MDFNPSACSVSLATVQSSLNLYHLNSKCCSSFACLPLITEPVAMAKYLNMLCRSSSPNAPEVAAGRVCRCVYLYVPPLTATAFLPLTPVTRVFFIFLFFISFSKHTISSSLLSFCSAPPQGQISYFPISCIPHRERALCLILSPKLHGSQKLWPCLERKCNATY